MDVPNSKKLFGNESLLLPLQTTIKGLINEPLIRIFILSIVCLMFSALVAVQPVAAQSSAPPELIDRVLNKADQALRSKRLTRPAHNNAFDRYSAILMVDPQNARAKAGLLAVRDAYIVMADNELASGSLHHAQDFLVVLKERYPHDAKVKQLARRIAQHKAVSHTNDVPVQDPTQKRFVLDGGSLKRRDAKTLALLQSIAARIEDTQESVLITARNDAEGRWIYRTLNAATPTFRVRGDIRLGSKPSVALLAPF